MNHQAASRARIDRRSKLPVQQVARISLYFTAIVSMRWYVRCHCVIV